MQTLKKILFILNPKERKQALLLMIMILIMAFLDMLGIASILPFMAVLTNPDVVETNIFLNKMFQALKLFGIENNKQFLFALGVLVFLLLVIGIIFKALTTYAQIRFTKMREYSVTKLLVECYLRQPYSWFLNRNSADLSKTVLSEAGNVTGSGIKPLIDLLATGMVVIAIITLLFFIDIKLALTIGLSFGIIYGLIFKFSKRYLNRLGEEKVTQNKNRFMALSEALGASKEIKVGGLEQVYIKRFSKSAEKFGENQTSASIIAALPRFAIEVVAFGGVMLLILYLMLQKGSFNNALPIISLYIFAGYRLMPALQQIYVSMTELTFVGPSLDLLYDDIKNLRSFDFKEENQSILPFHKSIALKNINYNYPGASRIALKNISFNIDVKTSVGLVGPTGCGKTTVVDIILGLLEPQKGYLEVDGKIITKQNIRAWQRSIGYVPQNIFLADDTLAANIAFGSDLKDINQEAVVNSSKIANLHNFVMNELPEKYQTTIGERGVRLSGGQKQRIGIARALYHKPQILILDEATSALDNQTEQEVMDEINHLRKDITIISIAHRLNSLKRCDNIIVLDKGGVEKQGSFEELIKVNKNFQISENINEK